jgi:hypothetical protein
MTTMTDKKRPHMLRVRLSDSELATIEALAEKAKATRSDVVRDLALKGKVQDTTKIKEKNELVRKKIVALNRINANLNMVAKWVNGYKKSAEAIEVITQLIAVERAILDDEL